MERNSLELKCYLRPPSLSTGKGVIRACCEVWLSGTKMPNFYFVCNHFYQSQQPTFLVRSSWKFAHDGPRGAFCKQNFGVGSKRSHVPLSGNFCYFRLFELKFATHIHHNHTFIINIIIVYRPLSMLRTGLDVFPQSSSSNSFSPPPTHDDDESCVKIHLKQLDRLATGPP